MQPLFTLNITAAAQQKDYMRNKFRYKTICVWLATALAGYFIMIELSTFGNSRFSKQKWENMANQHDKECVRGGMAEDISDNFIKPGMSIIEVKNILGQPQQEERDRIEYDLGMCGVLDDYSLLINLDENKKVRSTKIVQN